MWFKRKPTPPQPPRITLGTYGNGWGAQPFLFTVPQFRTHRLIRGVTGAGKSEFIKSLCLQLLQAGEHFTLIDPHSDTGVGILAYLKDTGYFTDERAFSRLWYIKWSRSDFCVPCNILNQSRYSEYELASYIHEAIARAFPTESSTPLLSSLLLYSLVVLIVSKLPITALLPMLSQRPLRETLLARVSDPMVVSFFHDQFDHWTRSAVESTVRRLGILLFSPVLRFSLGQRANILDLRRLIDEGVCLIHDLGGLDTDTAKLLSNLLTVSYEKAALSREDMAPELRTPHHLLIDEAPVVAASSAEAFSMILEQTRKYNLFLTLAAQTMQSFDKDLHDSLGNVGCEIVFRLSEADARASAHRFTAIDPSYIKRQRSDSNLETPAQLREATALTLEQLKTGQAWVRSGNRIQPITTLAIPPRQATRADIQELLDEYARRLGVPAAQAQREADAVMRPVVAQPQRGAKPPLNQRQGSPNVSYFDQKRA